MLVFEVGSYSPSPPMIFLNNFSQCGYISDGQRPNSKSTVKIEGEREGSRTIFEVLR